MPYENQCAYVGCSHIKEQECGIKQAVEKGDISKQRYQNSSKIYQDLKEKYQHPF